ncbi:MAG: hypothetical protein V2A71_04085 [Candidatus Eisenbacteria bacterium]
MSKVCWEYKKGDDLHVKCVETVEGFNIEVKGSKEALKQWKESCGGPVVCCVSGHHGTGHAKSGCC